MCVLLLNTISLHNLEKKQLYIYKTRSQCQLEGEMGWHLSKHYKVSDMHGEKF